MSRALKIVARFALALCLFLILNVVLSLIVGDPNDWQTRFTVWIIDLLLIGIAAIWSRQKALKEREKNERLIREYIEKNLS